MRRRKNAGDTHLTHEEKHYAHVCTKRDDRNDSMTGKPDEDLIKKTKTSVSTAQMTKRQTMRGKVQKIEELTVEKTTDASYRKATRKPE